MEKKLVLVNAPWSQKHGEHGMVVAEEDDEVVINFGNPLMNYRYSTKEVQVTDMQPTEGVVSPRKLKAAV